MSPAKRTVRARRVPGGSRAYPLLAQACLQDGTEARRGTHRAVRTASPMQAVSTAILGLLSGAKRECDDPSRRRSRPDGRDRDAVEHLTSNSRPAGRMERRTSPMGEVVLAIHRGVPISAA